MDVGDKSAYWVPELFVLLDAVLVQTLDVLSGLEVDRDRMRTNLGLSRGLLLAENVTTNSWWHQNANYNDAFLFGSSLKYNEAFNERYKRDATYLEAAATASCETLVLAIEEAKSTSTDAVRKVLHEKTFDTFYGPIHYGASGQNDVNAALVMQIQNNKLLVLAPEKLKQGELQVGVPKK